MGGISLNINVVTNLSFASIACKNNRSELSGEDDRGESREDIEVEDNNNMQSSTTPSASEGSNVNNCDEQQRNSTLRKIELSLERDVIFE